MQRHVFLQSGAYYTLMTTNPTIWRLHFLLLTALALLCFKRSSQVLNLGRCNGSSNRLGAVPPPASRTAASYWSPPGIRFCCWASLFNWSLNWLLVSRLKLLFAMGSNLGQRLIQCCSPTSWPTTGLYVIWTLSFNSSLCYSYKLAVHQNCAHRNPDLLGSNLGWLVRRPHAPSCWPLCSQAASKQ